MKLCKWLVSIQVSPTNFSILRMKYLLLWLLPNGGFSLSSNLLDLLVDILPYGTAFSCPSFSFFYLLICIIVDSWNSSLSSTLCTGINQKIHQLQANQRLTLAESKYSHPFGIQPIYNFFFLKPTKTKFVFNHLK